MDKLEILSLIVKELKKVYDPEISINIYDLGLVYKVDIDDDGKVFIEMTLTAPNCPLADNLILMTKTAVKRVKEVKDVDIKLVFEPKWDKSMISDEAMLELGLM